MKRVLYPLLLLLLMVGQVLAQDEEELGRAVTNDDWLGFIPIIIGSIVIVIIVDAVFIVPIFRNKINDEKPEGE